MTASRESTETPVNAKGRRPAPRIVDPETHPQRYVPLIVGAEYLEVDPRTLNSYIAEGLLPVYLVGRQRRLYVPDLAGFRTKQLAHAC